MSLFGKKKKEEEKDVKSREESAEIENDLLAGRQEKKPEVKIPKGGDDLAYSAIIRPHLTEKSSLMAEINKYVFQVADGANKIEIKKAIEKMYKVKVEKVAIGVKPAKTRRVGRHEGEKSGFKKAIVTLKKGDKIDIIT